MALKKLLITILLSLTISFSADYFTPIFYQLGADDSQIGHFMVGKTLTDFIEDGAGWTPYESFGVTLLAAVGKEMLDYQQGGPFNNKDVAWTMYGWVFKRFLTFEYKW